MKVTFIEEIEHKSVWRACMYCKRCDSYKIIVHHQLQPETDRDWWIECWNCGYESTPAFDYNGAKEHWRKGI